MHAFCDAGYATHRRFLAQAQRHLNPGGRLLLGFSSQGDERGLAGLLDEAGYAYQVLSAVQGEGQDAPRYVILQLLPKAQAGLPDGWPFLPARSGA